MKELLRLYTKIHAQNGARGAIVVMDRGYSDPSIVDAVLQERCSVMTVCNTKQSDNPFKEVVVDHDNPPRLGYFDVPVGRYFALGVARGATARVDVGRGRGDAARELVALAVRERASVASAKQGTSTTRFLASWSGRAARDLVNTVVLVPAVGVDRRSLFLPSYPSDRDVRDRDEDVGGGDHDTGDTGGDVTCWAPAGGAGRLQTAGADTNTPRAESDAASRATDARVTRLPACVCTCEDGCRLCCAGRTMCSGGGSGSGSGCLCRCGCEGRADTAAPSAAAHSRNASGADATTSSAFLSAGTGNAGAEGQSSGSSGAQAPTPSAYLSAGAGNATLDEHLDAAFDPFDSAAVVAGSVDTPIVGMLGRVCPVRGVPDADVNRVCAMLMLTVIPLTAAQRTRDWFTLRRFRVTASVAARMRTLFANGPSQHNKVWPELSRNWFDTKPFGSAKVRTAMRIGANTEDHILAALPQFLAQVDGEGEAADPAFDKPSCVLHPVGLLANRRRPWLACSPDSIAHFVDSGKLVPVEVKTRVSAATTAAAERIVAEFGRERLKCEAGDRTWRRAVLHKAQVTHQAAVLQTDEVLYVVASTTRLIYAVRIRFTKEQLAQYVGQMAQFQATIKWVYQGKRASDAATRVPAKMVEYVNEHLSQWRDLRAGILERDANMYNAIVTTLRRCRGHDERCDNTTGAAPAECGSSRAQSGSTAGLDDGDVSGTLLPHSGVVSASADAESEFVMLCRTVNECRPEALAAVFGRLQPPPFYPFRTVKAGLQVRCDGMWFTWRGLTQCQSVPSRARCCHLPAVVQRLAFRLRHP